MKIRPATRLTSIYAPGRDALIFIRNSLFSPKAQAVLAHHVGTVPLRFVHAPIRPRQFEAAVLPLFTACSFIRPAHLLGNMLFVLGSRRQSRLLCPFRLLLLLRFLRLASGLTAYRVHLHNSVPGRCERSDFRCARPVHASLPRNRILTLILIFLVPAPASGFALWFLISLQPASVRRRRGNSGVVLVGAIGGFRPDI